MATTFGAYVAFQFVATLYLQHTLGWSALHTALAFLPGGLIVAFGSPPSIRAFSGPSQGH